MGRGALYTFPVLRDKGILREYRRGGYVQRFLREGSLTNRPLREWAGISRKTHPYANDGPEAVDPAKAL